MPSLPKPSDAWWREGVLYQIYPRSYQDSDGDGNGDLQGIIDRLDHLEWLGIDGIWLSPTFPSPNADWGYDVADYRGVHPDFGTLEDMDRLIAEAGRRGIRVLLDLVPNHTSDQHPWFREAASSKDDPRRDWYVWADDDGPPNNWRAAFGGIAWTCHEPTGEWYLHNFTPNQPDLNWWNPEVREEFEDILNWWFDRGVSGFRIDVAHSLIKDRELRDDPPAGPDAHPHERAHGLVQVHSMNRPEGHEILRSWRNLADDRPEPHPILVGETFVYELDQLLGFYGAGDDELHLAFNIPFALEELAAPPLRGIVEHLEERLPEAAWPVYTGSNHDIGRLATRWAHGDESLTRVALMMLLTLRGTPFLYAGDEIGLVDGDIPEDRVRDVAGRDGCRTPIPWEGGPGGGFTTADDTWLPMTDPDAGNVAAQREDPGSTLNFVRDLVALRRAEPDLRSGTYATLVTPEDAWAWRRGDRFVVAVNPSDGPVAVTEIEGEVAIATDRGRDGEAISGDLELAPHSGVVVRIG